MNTTSFYERLKSLTFLDVTLYELANVERVVLNESNVYQIADSLNISGTKRNIIYRAFESLDKETKKNLLDAWKVYAKNNKKSELEPIICLTGLDTEGYESKILPTYQKFIDLISQANYQITIIGYHFTDGHDELIQRIDDRIKKDSIELKILTDHVKGKLLDKNHKYLRRWLSDTTIRFKLYSYEHPNEKELMHIKCMLIDDEYVYIGSSNFSYRGILKNIELGIIIKNNHLTNSIENIFEVIIGGNIGHIEKIDYKNLKI